MVNTRSQRRRADEGSPLAKESVVRAVLAYDPPRHYLYTGTLNKLWHASYAKVHGASRLTSQLSALQTKKTLMLGLKHGLPPLVSYRHAQSLARLGEQAEIGVLKASIKLKLITSTEELMAGAAQSGCLRRLQAVMRVLGHEPHKLTELQCRSLLVPIAKETSLRAIEAALSR